MAEPKKDVKIVIIGDSTVGKTSLIIRYVKNDFFADEYVPTIFDNYTCEVTYNKQTVNLRLHDTAGTEDYAEIRKEASQNTDVFLLCFAINNNTSFLNIKNKWYEEFKADRKAKFILVGTKEDLRDESNSPVTYVEGRSLADKFKMTYVECSSKTGNNVLYTFNTALTQALKKNTKNSNKSACTLL